MDNLLGQHEFQQAVDDVEGYPVQKLPLHCEMWIDYRLEAGKQVAEKHFVDHEKRRLTPRVPLHRGALRDDGTWQDEELGPIIRVFDEMRIQALLDALPTELKYEQAYWEYIIAHPCHAPLPINAEQDAMAALAWYHESEHEFCCRMFAN